METLNVYSGDNLPLEPSQKGSKAGKRTSTVLAGFDSIHKSNDSEDLAHLTAIPDDQ